MHLLETDKVIPGWTGGAEVLVLRATIDNGISFYVGEMLEKDELVNFTMVHFEPDNFCALRSDIEDIFRKARQ